MSPAVGKVAGVSRKAKRRAFSTYERVARCLLNKHGLRVSSNTVEMLAKTIRRHRDPPLPRYGPASRERAQKARTAAIRLCRYAEHGPPHPSSIPVQSARLRAALDHPVVRMSLALAQPAVDCAQMLSDLPTTWTLRKMKKKRQVEAIRRVKEPLEEVVRARS